MVRVENCILNDGVEEVGLESGKVLKVLEDVVVGRWS